MNWGPGTREIILCPWVQRRAAEGTSCTFLRTSPRLGSSKEWRSTTQTNGSLLVPRCLQKDYLLFERGGTSGQVTRFCLFKLEHPWQFSIVNILFVGFLLVLCQLLKTNRNHLLIGISLSSCKNLNKIIHGHYPKIHISFEAGNKLCFCSLGNSPPIQQWDVINGLSKLVQTVQDSTLSVLEVE